jgi:hypothetical protein
MTKKQQAKQQPQGRKPSHRLYRVVGDGDQATWTPIGAAWPNKDGMGFSISADAIPLQGRLMLRAIVERADGGQK